MMQIRAIAVWGWGNQEPRVMAFKPGALNIISGKSKTGKSALLDIVDYCFGRREESVAGDRIREAVSWYGVQFSIGSQFVFVGRPRTRVGAAKNTQALLLETSLPTLPGRQQLAPNTDVAGLRRRLSTLLGIGEFQTPQDESALGDATVASSGQAVLLCLQKQGEVANQDLLFHRQGERRVSQSLKDTFPYFLGAEPWGQAILQVSHREERRTLESLRNRLRAAESRDANFDQEIRDLIEEAFAVGLIESTQFSSRRDTLLALRSAATRELIGGRAGVDDSGERDERRLEIQQRLTDLRRQLRGRIEERAALRDLSREEDAYQGALRRQRRALAALELLPDRPEGAADVCPLCRSALAAPDPTVAQLRDLATVISGEMEGLFDHEPRRTAALERIGEEVRRLQREVTALEAALGALNSAPTYEAGVLTRGEELAFYRGRLSASVAHLLENDDSSRADRLRSDVGASESRLTRLDELLGRHESDLDSRLLTVSAYVTEYARMLDVDHSDRPVALDIQNLTTIVHAPSGRLRLSQVGSAANYMGLHLAVHLGLHRFFVEEDRPVPRFLFLDQPSQPFYPEDRRADTNEVHAEEPSGAASRSDEEVPERDADREAVRNMYRMLYRFVVAMKGEVQILVSDHVFLRDEDWFIESVVEEWRDGEAFIPSDWPAGPPASPADSHGSGHGRVE